jgi:hypothetical protein
MATLIPAFNSCKSRMTGGEKRFAERLEELLEPDYLCWYDVPIGSKYQHPDFVILHPGRGVLILEVKDWKRDTIQRIDPVRATILTNTGLKEEANPLLQARHNAFAVKNRLELDPQMRASEGHPHQGKLVCPYGYGVVLTNITRNQFDTTDLAEVLPPHLVICQDEMYQHTDPEEFQRRLWQMFNVEFPHVLTLPQIDRIRWHLFPEVRITQDNLFGPEHLYPDEPHPVDALMRVMDLQQEQLARSIGEGHRVIHGVAGSGKTLILGYRCEQLVKTMTKPILVLVYNISLAAKLENLLAERGFSERVTVRHFHRWCMDQITSYHVIKPPEGEDFYKALVNTVIQAVERGQIPRAQYGAVLIDEGHDFEADWLKLVTQMIDPVTNSLLLLYDDAQKIYGHKHGRHFSFKSVGIQAQGRTSILRINYRNTNEILDCAYHFARDILTPQEADEDGVPLIKPEMAGRHGAMPQLHRLPSLRAETGHLVKQLQQMHDAGTPWRDMAVLYSAPFVAEQLAADFAAASLPFEWLKDSRSKRYNALHNSIKVMHLKSSKGLEFPIVAIAGVGYLPYQNEAEEARLLYVGMTRATEHLLMTSSRNSAFVERLMQYQRAA